MRARLCCVALLASALVQGSASGSVEQDLLPLERLAEAVDRAGLRLVEVAVDVPQAVRPRLPFSVPSYDDPALAALRERYALEEVVSGGPDEWSRQLLLKQWVFTRIPGGNPRVNADRAMDILGLAAAGEQFYCTHYAITFVECARALGWQARKIAVDRKHGPEGMGSTHHGVAEIWSNQFHKWVVMDSQSNLHFEKGGIPLSAWEIRGEWLANQGVEVDRVIGTTSVKQRPTIVWWDRPEDETSTFFWLYLEAEGPDGALQLLLPLDQFNDGLIWYQNDDSIRAGRLHTGYLKNLFLPTRRIADLYWTVGIPEVDWTTAAEGAIDLRLATYLPDRTAFESSPDGTRWQRVSHDDTFRWVLKPGWNTLRLRAVTRGGVAGPVLSVVMLLEPAPGKELLK